MSVVVSGGAEEVTSELGVEGPVSGSTSATLVTSTALSSAPLPSVSRVSHDLCLAILSVWFVIHFQVCKITLMYGGWVYAVCEFAGYHSTLQ